MTLALTRHLTFFTAVASCALLSQVEAKPRELAWDLERGVLSYRLELEQEPKQGPEGVTLAKARSISKSDVQNGRPTPARELGDLVWYYALVVPDSTLPGRDWIRAAADDAFTFPKSEWRVRGDHHAKSRGKRVQLHSALTLESQGTDGPNKGFLNVERLFSVSRGRLEVAEFTLDLRDGNTSYRWKGRIRFHEASDPRSASFHARVQESIKRGVKYLQPATGARLDRCVGSPDGKQAVGRLALPVLALLRSGVSPRRLAAQFAWLDAQPFRETYSVALYLMALEARHVRRTSLPPRRNTRTVTRFDRQPVPADVQSRMAQAVRWLVGTRKHGEGWWSYSGHVAIDLDEGVPERTTTERAERTDGSTRERTPADGDSDPGPRPAEPQGGPLDHQGGPAARGDHSNTQFAVLALHSAMASGVEVPAYVWEEIYDEFRCSQAQHGPTASLAGTVFSGSSSLPIGVDPRDRPQGKSVARRAETERTSETPGARARGWSYTTRSSGQAYGSMTAAGASSMAIAREGLRETNRLTTDRAQGSLESLRDGLAWLLQNFDVTHNPGKSKWYFYWLYSLEKAMDTAGVERLGAHEWWREAALELMNRQGADGSWGDEVDTSFALLVLNRATLPARLDIETGKRRAATGIAQVAPWDRVHVEGVGLVSVRQVLTMLEQASPRETKKLLRLGRKAFRALESSLRPRVLPELAKLLDSGRRRVRAWARGVCRDLAGSTDPQRVDAVYERWEELYTLRLRGDHAGIPRALALLRQDGPPCIERAARETLLSLRAFEALVDFAAKLEAHSAAERKAVWSALTALAPHGIPGFDPAARASARKEQVAEITAWCERKGQTLVKAERIRRAVKDLESSTRAKSAEQRLRKAGDVAVRDLIDGLRRGATRERSHDLLCEITGKEFSAEVGPWFDWLERGRQ